ncbi:MAG TPA: class I SAM-dependent methyltransferase [Bacillales bacterium]|nr:class I SAM-dependent methyltransferase [Bacillales bacterium]
MDYHDMLAHVGAGGAHPGGFAATLNFLSHFPIAAGAKVLEVGSGTGQTACYLAEKGCDVTALDLREKMVEKTQKRAQSKGVNVKAVQGDVTKLPFEDESFDVVLGESVTVFADIPKALREYVRVLRPEGELFDRELMAVKPLPEAMKQAISTLYGAKELPSLDQWLHMIEEAGFKEVEVWNPTALADDLLHFLPGFDDPSLAEPATKENAAEIKSIQQQNLSILTKYEDYHGYGVFMGIKK